MCLPNLFSKTTDKADTNADNLPPIHNICQDGAGYWQKNRAHLG